MSINVWSMRHSGLNLRFFTNCIKSNARYAQYHENALAQYGKV